MAHATGSPLYQSLEMFIEEQVGRDRNCPGGAGILRSAGNGAGACINQRTGISETGSGGELWCVNCHAPGVNLATAIPAWSAFDPASRRPLRDLLPASAKEGISCAFCHQTTGPARPGAAYEGNPSWISPRTGERFAMRPEDERGRFGIANSGYALDRLSLLGAGPTVAGGAHRASSASARAYLGSSEFCGSCHDVRLFGTDSLKPGEHFKRLRNAYSEWVSWADDERREGRVPASCQDCHMSLYPGVCLPGDGDGNLCPKGTRFSPVAPGTYARGVHSHSFSGVDLPLDPAFDARALDDTTLDVDGVPLGAKQRRDMLLARTFRVSVDGARRAGGTLELPITVENIGAGHRVPAGFSQEREFWLHVNVSDARGVVLYEAGRVDRATDDLRDKLMLSINTRGTMGADVADGPDVPQWTNERDGTFRGRGLVNFQNGFLRCVRCIGEIDARGTCQPLPGQERARADRYADGDYDPDTGECRSNLRGTNAFVEIYFPVGSLDASRGEVRGPDAIVDTRSLPPNAPQTYVHELAIPDASGPLRVDVTLRFRAFPPYLIRAFIDYEREQQRLGLRAGGVLVDARALERLDVVDVAHTSLEIP
jgi:eukaryotic-like serine/threonine-protein kinase